LRHTRLHPLIDEKPVDQLPEYRLEPAFPDPLLQKAIRECIDRLPTQPKTALNARFQDGHMLDRDLAQRARMKLNTFLRNIVRARKLMAECLERRGVRFEGIFS
jgi:DNA-directed RNA polymerase specialized sigma24 family protein